MIRFHLLGAIDLRDGEGRKLSAIQSQPKRLALLSYLCIAAAEAPVRRDTVLGLLWPELDEERARNALSKGLHHLRHELGPDVILTHSLDEIEVDPRLVWSDVRAFREALGDERIPDALNLYRGHLLPGFFVSEAPGFEKWLEREGRHLRELAANAARVYAERLLAEHRVTDAVRLTRRAVELAEHDERMLRRLLVLLESVGDRHAAIRTYEEFAALLQREYGTTPAPETQELIRRIREDRSPAPASPSPPGEVRPSDQVAASLADRYILERQLGAGASATVHLATDRKLHRKVAIKVLRPAVAASLGTGRFLQEILIAAPLTHPHIVPLLDSGEAGGLLFYVMPWLTGESLRDRIAREGRLPVEDALAITREIADALAYAHAHGVVHRDIKPENILLESGHALVADFGIARAMGSSHAPRPGAPPRSSGTPAYVSPEQSVGQGEQDGRGDIYSLGCVLFEMLTGRPPFAGNSVQAILEQHRSATPPDIDTLRPDLPTGLNTMIAKALAKDPADRFALADELGRALGTMEAATAVRRSDRRRALVAGTVAAVMLLLGAGTIAAYLGSKPLPPSLRPQVLLANVAWPDDTASAPALMVALRAYLAGSERYQLVPDQRNRSVLRRMGLPKDAWIDDSTAREIAAREGIPMIISVSVKSVRGRHLLVGEITDPDGRVLDAARVTADSEAAILPRLGDLSQQLRMMAGDRRADVRARAPLPQVTTSSLAALRIYARAVTNGEGRAGPPGQIALLEQAVALDSGFATAFRLLAIRYLQARRFSDSRRAFALAQQHRERLTPIERLLLDANQANRAGYPDTIAERTALDRVLALDPQNWIALANRGNYEVWQQDPARAEEYAARALRIDSLHEGGWLLQFWIRLNTGDTAGASLALRAGRDHNLQAEPFLHEWSIYGWRTGDFSEVVRQLDSIGGLPGVKGSSREDLPIIGSAVDYITGHHKRGEERWRQFALRITPGRRDQILASTLYREAQCRMLQGEPSTAIARTLAPRIAEFDLSALGPDERVGTLNYLAGAWGWLGRADETRALLATDRTPDSLLAPFLVHNRNFALLLALLGEKKDSAVIVRAHLHNNSPQTGIIELPLALAYDRLGVPDSVIAAGERFFNRRTFIAIASDLSCAEQAMHLRVAELYEARGDTARALHHYRIFASTWADPDPALRPQVVEVRKRITRLTPRVD